ncbi:hypothetical protein GGS24DRAFT_504659 [Hypoxylon argillaceum]|nr:hypothetical protein GGS24DRAFT_504659 [Hypoxylon argillaceum]
MSGANCGSSQPVASFDIRNLGSTTLSNKTLDGAGASTTENSSQVPEAAHSLLQLSHGNALVAAEHPSEAKSDLFNDSMPSENLTSFVKRRRSNSHSSNDDE